MASRRPNPGWSPKGSQTLFHGLTLPFVSYQLQLIAKQIFGNSNFEAFLPKGQGSSWQTDLLFVFVRLKTKPEQKSYQFIHSFRTSETHCKTTAKLE
jgi:hypothetical protein